MPVPLRVLVVEDSEDDALLLVAELRAGGFAPEYRQVQTDEAMRAALAEHPWEVVIADHQMPHFSGPEALAVLHESGLDIPFIVVTGTVSEEDAVQIMRAGAHDFISKGSLHRLVPAVQRELREAEVRRERRRAEEELVELLERERQARARAEEASAAKDRFLGVVSHELRNPLAAVMAGVGVLRRRLPPDAWAQRTLAIVERNVEIEARLIGDLLDLTRLTRGELEMERTIVPLDAIVAKAVEGARPDAERTGISLHAELQAGLCVWGDPERLRKAIAHLLTNALRFTPAGGHVSVYLRVQRSGLKVQGDGEEREVPTAQPSGAEPADGQPEPRTPNPEPSAEPRTLNPEPSARFRAPNPQPSRARIVVEDDGAGIVPELMPRLFQTFERGEMGGWGAPGLGIGLSMVRMVIEAHGGRVWAESEGPGRGTRITIDLPLAEAGAAQAGE